MTRIALRARLGASAVAVLVVFLAAGCTKELQPVAVRSTSSGELEVLLHSCNGTSSQVALMEATGPRETSTVWEGPSPAGGDRFVIPYTPRPGRTYELRKVSATAKELTTTFGTAELRPDAVTYTATSRNVTTDEDAWRARAEAYCDPLGFGTLRRVVAGGTLALSAGVAVGGVVMLARRRHRRPT